MWIRISGWWCCGNYLSVTFFSALFSQFFAIVPKKSADRLVDSKVVAWNTPDWIGNDNFSFWNMEYGTFALRMSRWNYKYFLISFIRFFAEVPTYFVSKIHLLKSIFNFLEDKIAFRNYHNCLSQATRHFQEHNSYTVLLQILCPIEIHADCMRFIVV